MSSRVWGLGFPKIRGTFWGNPYNQDYSILVSILGSGNYHVLILDMLSTVGWQVGNLSLEF